MSNYHSGSLAQWLERVLHLHPKNIEMGLDRVRIVRQRLKTDFDCPVITVGGTNGKGSTCMMMQAILQKAGYRVGLYTSPHIHNFEERLTIDGQSVPEETFVHYFNKVEKARGDIQLTFFEFTTLVVLQILAKQNLDVAILEVGLGGRLDAVNLIDANVAVVTNVDIDHVDYLGHTRELIGFEKAGIFRQGKVAIYGDYDPPQSLVQCARNVGAELRILGQGYSSVCRGNNWSYTGQTMHFAELDPPALHGKNQIKNATIALMALEAMAHVLPVDERAVRAGLAHAFLPGRFQILEDEPLVILDAAHNPHAAAVLAENLRSTGDSDLTHAVYGAMADKDIDGVIAAVQSSVDYWYLTDLPIQRAATARMLKEKLVAAAIDENKIRLFDEPAKAMEAAKIKAQKNDKIIAFGTFWIVTGIA